MASTALEAVQDWLLRFPHRPINHSLPPSLILYLVPPLPSRQTTAICLTLVALIAMRLYFILPGPVSDDFLRRAASKSPSVGGTKKEGDQQAERKVRVGLFLGSGGHTTELLQLLRALPPGRYAERLYLYSSGDNFSLQKAREFERTLVPRSSDDTPPLHTLEVPRARRVHQSFLSTPLSLLYSLAFCIDHIVRRPLVDAHITRRAQWRQRRARQGWNDDGARCPFADLVLMNGPGTCVPIVVSIYLLKFLGLPSPKLIYIESFARVKSLSLTAKLVRPLVDRFVVQWPEAAGPLGGRTVYNKWLI
ncbi:uncharacterized protein PFL1_02881 [Pseudozyma flocculosa PF-1]|uniref:UDP-N-acetylglucosamine transferase subunit ALG14 n=2 Tax=Pseudozyma flocculosa TaxID=84751 RepID=A0A5C3F453_9BASI|nr:uncharacterized protein PFL1_02881 [Pseudozyma flocculosa PF-1]EPQ29661.1 hypothetical protein PFL1_02881 [Pseudozyma flocculosa PF-1]SPO38229.1 related to ALG14 - component of UDP-GlcNAc transferase [Pseudozyma flocculosa]